MRKSNLRSILACLATSALWAASPATLLAAGEKDSGSLKSFPDGPGGDWPLLLAGICGVFLCVMIIGMVLKGRSLDDEADGGRKGPPANP